MKAVVLRSFGASDQLVLENVPDPGPKSDEVVVRVATVSINRSFDLSVRKGSYARGAVLPLVLGADPAGTIVAVGADVTEFKTGDRVAVMSTIACGQCHECRSDHSASCGFSETIGVHRWGGYAEYVSVPASNVARIPDRLGFGEATVIARHGAAAYNFLVDRGRLRAGETVVVFGASGALGAFAVQVAKMAGATVLAVAGAEDRADFARRLGADVAINYRSTDVEAAVFAHTKGRGADLAFESSGDPDVWPIALRCLAQTGRIVNCGAHGGGNVELDLRRIYIRRLSVIGAAGVSIANLDFALAAGAGGALRATIDRVFPLAQAGDAHDYVERERPMGKVLISPILGTEDSGTEGIAS